MFKAHLTSPDKGHAKHTKTPKITPSKPSPRPSRPRDRQHDDDKERRLLDERGSAYFCMNGEQHMHLTEFLIDEAFAVPGDLVHLSFEHKPRGRPSIIGARRVRDKVWTITFPKKRSDKTTITAGDLWSEIDWKHLEDIQEEVNLFMQDRKMAACWIEKLHGLGYKILIGDPAAGDLTSPSIPNPVRLDEPGLPPDPDPAHCENFRRWVNDDFEPPIPDPASYGIYPNFVTADYPIGDDLVVDRTAYVDEIEQEPLDFLWAGWREGRKFTDANGRDVQMFYRHRPRCCATTQEINDYFSFKNSLATAKELNDARPDPLDDAALFEMVKAAWRGEDASSQTTTPQPEPSEQPETAYGPPPRPEPSAQRAKAEPPKQEPERFKAEAYNFPPEESLEAYDWLYGRHLLRGEVCGSAAGGGTGKSSDAIVEALSMTSGKQLLHDSVFHRPLRVVLINLEDNRSTMAKRIAAAMKHHGLKPEDIGDRLIVIAKGEIKFKIAKLSKKGDIVRNENVITMLTNLMIEKKADVLSIDSFIRTHKVRENENSDIEQVIECYETIAQNAKCCVHLWHHTRKGKGDGGSATVESSRGAMAFIDGCRSVRVLETMTEKQAQHFGIETNHRQYFRAFSGKRNFAPHIEDSNWFYIKSVELLNGDNIGVVEMWTAPSVEITPAMIKEIKAILADGQWRESVQAAMWAGKAIGPIINLNPDSDRATIKELINDLIKDGVLMTVTALDEKRKNRLFIVPGKVDLKTADADNPFSEYGREGERPQPEATTEITNSQRQRLFILGYRWREVCEMTPEKAHEILKNNTKNEEKARRY